MLASKIIPRYNLQDLRQRCATHRGDMVSHSNQWSVISMPLIRQSHASSPPWNQDRVGNDCAQLEYGDIGNTRLWCIRAL